ncbi:unnamed protein product [Heligmosomoides polygyrus]|uniref:Secreted protein n=1 Tax=Heligmosomoides polygyrus TaxID=6339 RepID=A0A183FLY0_HELPZ|nr:unnamed protein product [Heligmosomoides polygyrus]
MVVNIRWYRGGLLVVSVYFANMMPNPIDSGLLGPEDVGEKRPSTTVPRTLDDRSFAESTEGTYTALVLFIDHSRRRLDDVVMGITRT